MSRIVVIGGTGYAGSAIAKEAASRGHQVTAFSRSLPEEQVAGIDYVQGDATEEAALEAAISGADVVVAALAPRGPLAEPFREVNRTIARLADAAGARLFVVGGYSSLRPEAGAPRFVEDISHVPEEIRDEVLAGAALVIEDLPATPDSLDWVFVSPALGFGSFAPGQQTGEYRRGDEVAVVPDGGGEISAPDYALGFVDLIEAGGHKRSQVNLAH
jgi:uncharacterized protein